jgi:hypothetical protein
VKLNWKTHHDYKMDWHPHFAWWPRQVAKDDTRWLEWVERRGDYWDCWGNGGWAWEYRARKEKA